MKIMRPALITSSPPGTYLVGGAVRDLIRGHQPTDLDIAVISDPEGFANRLADRIEGHWVLIGKNQLSVYRVICGEYLIDVSAVKGRNIFADLLERDFTINALACDLASGYIIDCTGGLNDLSRAVIRMVLPANMLQDPIRLLRAYRMAAGFHFQIERQTLNTIKSQAAHIKTTAGERVWAELRMILAADNSYRQIVAMAESGLLQAILPELAPLTHCSQNEHHTADVWGHTLAAYAALESLLNNPKGLLASRESAFVHSMAEESRILIKLSILLHDIGKPQSRSVDAGGKVRFINHAALGAHIVRRIGQRLRMSKVQCEWITFMVCHHQRPLTLFLCQRDPNQLPTRALGRFLHICAGYTPYLLLHAMADALGKRPGVDQSQKAIIDFLRAILGDYFKRVRPLANQAPLLNGDDLIQTFHLQPSPLIGHLLKRVHEAQLSGMIDDREKALQWVQDLLAKHSPDSSTG